MKKFALLFLIVTFAACSKERVKITGKIDNADKQVLHLEEVNVYDNTHVDSIVLDKKGKFSFSFKNREPGFYQLRIGKDQLIVLFPYPGQRLKVNADAKDLNASLRIEGSEETSDVTELIRRLHYTIASLDSIVVLFNNEKSDSGKLKLNKEYNYILERHRKYSMGYILSHYKSLTGVYALYQQYQPGSYVFYKTSDLQFFRILSDSLNKYHPGSKHVSALKAFTSNRISQYQSRLMMQKVKETSLPAVKLPDMRGDTISLTNFKGKYLLLAFWVPGDQNCTAQNLQLKKIYSSFRAKGFEILQVALDNNTDRWKTAVRYDELPWVSLIDTRFPNSIVAGNYNVTSVPANYLISKDNVSIMASDLTPALLRDKLNDLLK